MTDNKLQSKTLVLAIFYCYERFQLPPIRFDPCELTSSLGKSVIIWVSLS